MQLCIKSVLRIALIVSAGITTLVSAITIGIVNRNGDINHIRNPGELHSIKQLETLVSQTLATAEWLIVFNIIVIFWEAVHAILPPVTYHFSLLQRYSIVIMLTDAVFSCLAVICALASMIACIVHADSWGQPPEVCDQHGRFYRGLDCDHTQLEGTNGTAAFVCIIQVTLLVVLGVLACLNGFPKTLIFLQRLGTRKSSSEEDEQHVYIAE